MAKKVEKKKTVKKTTNNTKKNIKKVEKVEKEDIDEIVEIEEYDDEEDIKPAKKMYKEKKSILPKRKQDVLGDSLLKQNAEVFTFFKILIGILIFLGIFYFLVALARGEIGKKKTIKQDEPVRTIQNQEILATSVFTKEDREYYVLLYNSKDEDASFYQRMYNDYVQSNPVISMFYVDLNNGFNKDIVSDTSNPKAQKFSELKVTSPALIHIKNGTNIGYYENEEVAERMKDFNR